MLKKTLCALTLAAAATGQLYAASPTECNATDSKDIRTVIEDYVNKNTHLTANQINILSLRCMDNYASAMMHPRKPVTDDATVYLQKKGPQWEVLSLGTAFDEEFLSSIPKELHNPN